MPKQRLTKESVLGAAFRLLREGGEEQVRVNSIAAALSCSVQPIYSYCENMDALRQELSEMAGDFMRDYIGRRINKEHYFESTGKAYIAFAKEEPNLFKSFFLRRRNDVNSFDDLYAAEATANMAAHLAKTHGISESSAKKLHLNMIVYSTGLSFMMISAGCNISGQELNERIMDAYEVFLAAAKKEGGSL